MTSRSATRTACGRSIRCVWPFPRAGSRQSSGRAAAGNQRSGRRSTVHCRRGRRSAEKSCSATWMLPRVRRQNCVHDTGANSGASSRSCRVRHSAPCIGSGGRWRMCGAGQGVLPGMRRHTQSSSRGSGSTIRSVSCTPIPTSSQAACCSACSVRWRTRVSRRGFSPMSRRRGSILTYGRWSQRICTV